MNDFEIKIVSAAELGGINQTKTGLEELAKKTAEDSKATSENAAQTSKLSLKKAELKKLVGELGREFPIAGQAMRLMMNPLVAGISLAIGYFSKLKADIASFSADLDPTVWEGYGKAVEAQKNALAEVTAGAAAFAREMERVRNATVTASDAGQRLMDVYKAQLSAQEKLDAAHKALEVARVEQGERDPVRRQARLLEIEERYAARARARADESSRFELAQQRRKMEGEERASKAYSDEAARLAERLKGLKSEGKVNEELRIEKERLATIQAEMAEKEKKAQDLRDKWLVTPVQNEDLVSLDQQMVQLQSQLNAQRSLVQYREAAAPGQIQAWRAGQEAVSSAQDAAKSAAQRAGGIAAMLPTQEAVAGIEARSRSDVGGVESLTRGTQALRAGQEESKRLVDEAIRQVEKTGQVGRGLSQALQRQGDWNDAMTVFVKRLESQIGNLRNR